MSQENIDLCVKAFEAWNREGYEAWIEAFDSECTFWPLRTQLEGHPYLGHAGLRQFARELTDEFEGGQFVLDETRDAGDSVVVLAHFGARGRTSGAELSLPIGVIATMHAGKIVEGRMYSDPLEALEAAGLAR